MQIKKYLAFLIIITFAISCKKTPVETDNIFKYRDYISYTTSGRVSVADPIRINLAQDVEGWETEQTIDAQLVKMHPYVEGKLQTLNKHTLLFTPDEPMDPNTEYTATVDLSDIYKDIPNEFEYYTFQFKTIIT